MTTCHCRKALKKRNVKGLNDVVVLVSQVNAFGCLTPPINLIITFKSNFGGAQKATPPFKGPKSKPVLNRVKP